MQTPLTSLKFPIFELKGIEPCIPSISMVGKDLKDPLIYGSGSFTALAFGVSDLV
jgi:hypothetical protein